jgi:hypothetical protein
MVDKKDIVIIKTTEDGQEFYLKIGNVESGNFDINMLKQVCVPENVDDFTVFDKRCLVNNDEFSIALDNKIKTYSVFLKTWLSRQLSAQTESELDNALDGIKDAATGINYMLKIKHRILEL